MIGFLALVGGCDSTVETQDGGAASVGGGGGQADLPEPQSCEEFCEFAHSVGCTGCACTAAVPDECIELAKKGWACVVENYDPEACGSSGCFETLEEEATCEEMHKAN